MPGRRLTGRALENEIYVIRSVRREEIRTGNKYLTKKGRDFLRRHRGRRVDGALT